MWSIIQEFDDRSKFINKSVSDFLIILNALNANIEAIHQTPISEMPKLSRQREAKICEHCGASDAVLFRVRLDSKAVWKFICKTCQTKAKEASSYQYGGTWKQNKRN